MNNDPYNRRLDRVRASRTRPEPDLSLGFLKQKFQRDVARPHKQLSDLVELWARLVPVELARHTRLDSLSRGVLRVSVDSSARLYELDGLLRAGLERRLVQAHAGPAFRRVKLALAPAAELDPGET